MNRVPMTVVGEKKLRDELQNLKTVERPRIINAIAEARAHGDLKENAEYHAAREQQAFTEGRILEIEGKLANSQVIDIKSIQSTGRIIFGATVTLQSEETNKRVVYKIVGEDESDISINKISVTSPIARALIGKEEGEVIDVAAPEGVHCYKVLKVEHI